MEIGVSRRVALSLAVAIGLVVAARAQNAYVPERVFDAARGQFTDFEVMLADLARADVVLVGEQHDDANTHRLELAVLQGLARRRDDVVVSLEMFERDVQEPLDRFLKGQATESELLSVARPWPRYLTDYKPLVDFALVKHWPVVASNVPRSMASDVSKNGLDLLARKPDAEKKWFAADLDCPLGDNYFRRFGEAMGEHPQGAPGSTPSAAEKQQTVERFYFAQCLKDETMAESIARAWRAGVDAGKRPVVVHYNGAFHSDFREGTAARARRRLPDQRFVVVTITPVADLDVVMPDAVARTRADYLVWTIKN